jgi:Fe-S cluster biogenesis protein NfuA
MGADNYAKCPRCQKALDGTVDTLSRRIAEGYGKVSLAEYTELQNRLAEAVVKAQAGSQTFREEYEIYGAADGDVVVDYGGRCSECGLSLPATVTVTVTQEHIDHGKPCDCSECAMALAFLAAIPGSQLVTVTYSDRDGDDAQEPEMHAAVDFSLQVTGYYRLTYEAAAFVARFDDGLPVTPFTFDAELLAL